MTKIPTHRTTLCSLMLVLPAIFIQILGAQSPTETEQTLIDLIINDSRQLREELVFDETLHYIARKRAADMADRGYFSHVDPDGIGPNRLASLAGYDLPSSYRRGKDANFIESIAAGYRNADIAFNALIRSTGHRTHLFAEADTFKAQTRIGIGHVNVPGSPYTNYYAIIIAPPEPVDRPLGSYTRWLFDHFTLPELDAHGDEDDPDGNGIPRIVEFALNIEPGSQDARVPTPRYSAARRRLEWRFPIRRKLGRVRVDIEYCSDLGREEFSTDEVELSDGLFCSPSGNRGFMRYSIYRSSMRRNQN